MSSLSEDAYVGTLHYKVLDPPISGGGITPADLLPITLDQVNNRVGINQTTPNYELEVSEVIGFTNDIDIRHVDNKNIKAGFNAGVSQITNDIAMGNNAGLIQGGSCVAIGTEVGDNQGVSCIAIGDTAGQGTQRDRAIAIGKFAGGILQDAQSIAIGFKSGQTQGLDCIAIGNLSGQNQNENCIAIGDLAGLNSQDDRAIAIGYNAGESSEPNSIAIGSFAGKTNQLKEAVAIGTEAGDTNQGAFSIAIGNGAGKGTCDNNCIVLNASGSGQPTGGSKRCYINPIRGATNPAGGVANSLWYDTVKKEVLYHIP